MPDITPFLHKLALMAVPMLLAVTVHEVAHGYVAWLLGDPTAKRMGRLTLNPLVHLDPVGTLVFVISQVIGWAKPVPINPSYFKNVRLGEILVSVAGPGANFLLALLSALFFRLLNVLAGMVSPDVVRTVLEPLGEMAQVSVLLNLGLGLFNLFPLPPLDGSHILLNILPPALAQRLQGLERWSFPLIILLAALGVFGAVLGPARMYLYRLLMPPF